MTYKPQLYKDPLAEIGEFKFSDIFLEGGPDLESDFTVQVYRSGHRKAVEGRMALARAVDFTSLTEAAEGFQKADDAEDEDERNRLTLKATKLLGDLPEGQIGSLLEESHGGAVSRLVHDIVGLRVKDENGEATKINLSDIENEEERDKLLRQTLSMNEYLEPMIRRVSEEKELAFQSYVKQAKNESAPTSTKKRGGQRKTSRSSAESVSEAISSSAVQ